MSKGQLIKNINNVERIASISRVRRMLINPFRYFNAILFREIIYRKTKREKEVTRYTFFNIKMHLLLPSSTDIYLTGGKSHNSEIRLAKLLINKLKPHDTFIDVGAHYGYFTLLGSQLVGNRGKVYSFEASPITYNIHNKNTALGKNITSHNCVVSDETSELIFYEFPNLYSEYNSLSVDQFRNESWFSENIPQEIKIQSIVLDEFINTEKINPKVIKIDVEGAEFKVINGIKKFLTEDSPIVIIEYLSDERGNEEHRKAEKMLNSLGYDSCIIDNSGNAKQIKSIPAYLKERELESDNVVFVKKRKAT